MLEIYLAYFSYYFQVRPLLVKCEVVWIPLIVALDKTLKNSIPESG